MRDNGRDRKMNRETDVAIRQIEFELEKTEHGLAVPYDAECVGQLRHMLREAPAGCDVLNAAHHAPDRPRLRD